MVSVYSARIQKPRIDISLYSYTQEEVPNELLKDLLKYAEKFMNSQYECNIAIGDASYKNIDLLSVYKINQLCKFGKINETERNHLLDLHYQKIVLEKQLGEAETEKESDLIDQKLISVCDELAEHGLNEELSIEYLISNTQTNNNFKKTIDNNLLIAIIRISEILREEHGLSLEESVKCINSYGDILVNNESKENLEFFLSTSLRTWVEKMYNKCIKPKRECIAHNIVAELMKKQKEVETIISDDTYVNWLNEFMADKERFSDDDWTYNPEEISKEDLEKVGKLYFLFEGIDDYAAENNINAASIYFGVCYNIKYNDFMFKVGICVGQGGFCFCEKIKDDEDVEFIDFNDVIKSKRNKEDIKKKVLK